MENLKVGIIGLGRMGMRYLNDLHYRIKNASLIAVCSIREKELDYAQHKLGIRQVYSDYRELLALNELDAVFIASSTSQHTRHFLQALESGLHVFCEKPLATNVEDCKKVITASKRRASQHAVTGFVRRYDRSYQYAKEKIESGLIGKPFMVRSQTVDLDVIIDPKDGYNRSSGGIFLDYNVHDIDLARWYLGGNFDTVYSIGGAFKHKAFRELNDGDNVMTLGKMTNGNMASLFASRTAMHGHDTYTEITGTEGIIRIGRPSTKNRVEILDKNGIRKESVKNFYERFEDAFLRQTQEFVNSVLSGKRMKYSLEDAMEATRTAVAMTKSFLLKQEVKIDR